MHYGDPVGREDVLAVFPEAAALIADALGRNVEEVRLEHRLIDDLGAESIDFLDIVYRLERAFRVKIPRGQIERHVRGGLSDQEFEKKGVLTEAGAARVREFLTEVPPERFPSRLRVADIPLLFTVETFCKIVVRSRREA